MTHRAQLPCNTLHVFRPFPSRTDPGMWTAIPALSRESRKLPSSALRHDRLYAPNFASRLNLLAIFLLAGCVLSNYALAAGVLAPQSQAYDERPLQSVSRIQVAEGACVSVFPAGVGKFGLRNNCKECKIAIVSWPNEGKQTAHKVPGYGSVTVPMVGDSFAQLIGEHPCTK